tara:strand:+ start:1877 stop:2812 length:936 start_codon:yes stop_codon:yes gene_type:complete
MYSISIIIPCYNEVKNIELFLLSFKNLKLTEKYNLEFIFIDDGSNDETWKIIKNCKDKFKFNIKGEKKLFNQGKDLAILSGLKYVTKNNLVIMDVDQQHPIKVIENFINIKKDKDIELILTDRIDKKISFLRKIFSKIYNKIINNKFRNIKRLNDYIFISGNYLNFFLKNYNGTSSIKVFILKSAPSIEKSNIDTISYMSEERSFGKSKYNYLSLGNIAIRDFNFHSKSLINFIIINILIIGALLFSLILFSIVQMFFLSNYLQINFSSIMILMVLIIQLILLFGICILQVNLSSFKLQKNKQENIYEILE